MDDLLYGSTKQPRGRVPYDEPWSHQSYQAPYHSRPNQPRHPNELNHQAAPMRSRSAKCGQARKNHSLSPHRPPMSHQMSHQMTTSTMIKGLQVEYNPSGGRGLNGDHSSSTGRSTSSDKSQSPSNISAKNQIEILDQMDYYRSAMTRGEAEKV